MEGPGDGDLSAADYSRPSRTCDVVMKGGITSGVVYPHAVCALARTYTFRNVGGTSAGAIAAAATAAAEYGRDRGGFRELAALPAWIGSGGNLLGLFQPQAGTAGLFAVLVGALEGGPARACRVALLRNPVAALGGAALGIALFVLALVRGLGHGLRRARRPRPARRPVPRPRRGGAGGLRASRPTAHAGRRRQRVRALLGRAGREAGRSPRAHPLAGLAAQPDRRAAARRSRSRSATSGPGPAATGTSLRPTRPTAACSWR